MEFLKPVRLTKNDTVALVSLSWGGPHSFPHVYDLGVKQIQKLGLKTKELNTVRASPDFLYEHPEARARDLNMAFADPEVKAIVSTIGGEDSIRILPYLNREVIRSNPKIFMGYSDTTSTLTYCNQIGLVTFYGPAVMAGFSQMESLPPAFTNHIRDMLFHPRESFDYHPFDKYSDGYPDWSNPGDVGKVKPPVPSTGWKWLQGDSISRGRLFGGNVEVLEWLRGTSYWPTADFWNEKILFLETSEEQPHRSYVRRWLRTFGVSGGLDRIKGLLIGRARDYSQDEKEKLDQNIVEVVSREFDRSDLPIVSNMDFGHTDPQFIVPLGINAEINCDAKRFRLVEPAVT